MVASRTQLSLVRLWWTLLVSDIHDDSHQLLIMMIITRLWRYYENVRERVSVMHNNIAVCLLVS